MCYNNVTRCDSIVTQCDIEIEKEIDIYSEEDDETKSSS